jgi:hypothetical protein
MKSTTDFPASDDAACSRCLESRKLADDALATLRAIKEKYGLGDRHVMREKNLEIEKLREVIRAATVLIAAKGRHNTMLAYEGLRSALSSENDRRQAIRAGYLTGSFPEGRACGHLSHDKNLAIE